MPLLYPEEDALAFMQRLLRDDVARDCNLIESSQLAIEDSLRLLAKIAEDHPDID